MLRLVLPGILALASSAHAGETPDLAFVGLHQPELTPEQQQRLALGMVHVVEGTHKARALLPAQLASTIEGREGLIVDDGLAAPARRKLAAGIDLYNQAQPEAAIALLEQAVEDFQLGFPGRHEVDDLWRAWVYLAVARLQLGVDGVDEAMAAAATLAPSRALDPALFPPDAVASYTDAVARLAANPVVLTVQSTTPGEAWVDGVSIGPTPAVKADLGPGVHHVVVRAPGGRGGYARVLLESAPPPEPEPAPEPDPEAEGVEGEPAVARPPEPVPLPPRAETVKVTIDAPRLGSAAGSRPRRSEQVGALYRALGTRAAGVDLVLLGGVEGDALSLQLYDVNADTFSRPLEVPFEGTADDEMLTSLPLLMNLVDRNGQLTSTVDQALPLTVGTNTGLASMLLDPPEPVPLVARRSGGKGWVVGAVIAGVAVAAAGGTVAYVLSQQEAPAPTTTTPTGPVDNGAIVVTF